MPGKPDLQHLAAEKEDLLARLERAEESLREILSGEADALFVSGQGGAQLFALKGADQSYRTLIENMSEGALTLTPEGLILYANRRFAEMLRAPLEKVIGSEIRTWFAVESRQVLRTLLREDTADNRREELALAATDGTQVPVNVSVRHLILDEMTESFCMVATDLTEQKRNEAILAGERLSSAILRQSADAIVICDATGRIIRASRQAEALCGNSPVGQPFEHAFPMHQLDGTAFPSFRDIGTIFRQSVEARLEHNGRGFNLLVSVGHLKGEKDELLGSVFTLTDITAIKQVEKALRESESEFRTLTESMPQIVWITRPDGENIYFNHQWMDYTGLTLDESLGPGWNKPFHPDDRQRAWDAWQRAIAEIGIYSIEIRMRRADGIYHWWLVRGVPFKDAAGNILKWFGTCTDIHDLKSAELQIADANRELRRFRAAMELSGDAILLIDRASLRYVDVNQSFCDMVGRSREELLGMTPLDVFSADRETLERDYDALIADNAAPASSVEGEYRHGDGSVVPIETRRRAMHTDQGWVIVATARDLSKRKKAERRIVYLNRVLGVLSGINTLIVRVRDRDELFREACRIAVEGGGFRTALICELDQSGGTIVPAASAGLDVALMAEIGGILASPEKAAATMIARAMRKKKAIVSNDSQSDPQALLRGKHGESGVRSLAVLPLIVAGEAIGALALYAGEVEFFHAEEMRLLTELAGDISFALDNLGRQRRVDTLSRIRAVSGEIDAAVIRVADGEALFRETCRIMVEVGGLKMAWVGVTDPRTGVVRAVASHGEHAEEYLRGAGITGDGASTHGRGPSGTASNSDQPVWCDDFCHDPLTAPWHAQGVRFGWKSSAALPLHQDGRLVGVLSLYAGGVAAFDAEEQRLLMEIAGRISFALDHIKNAEKLRYLAYHDELTGLANRSQYLERVALHVRSAASRGHGLAVFLIDLERFKNINDTLGRPAGDLLLQQVADWLGRNLGDADLIARISADQFALVLPEIRRNGDLVRLLEKTMAAFAEHVFVQGDMQLRVAVRVGVAIFPEDGADADTLFRNAEAALKKAKVDGDRYLFHTQQMTEAAAGKLVLENQLREALDKEQFELYYQPKVTLAGGKLTGVEALIRWNDPRTGLVPPGRFIPILEDTGMINEVGRWALRRAVRDYLRWRAAGLPAVRIAVNVSPLQLRNRGFIAEIEQVIGIDPYAPAGLELEITESLIMSDVALSIASLRSIRALGVSVAIDDFGTGFSSLAYLARLPVDTLKIDRSFVVDMTSGPQGLALVSTIINLAHSLKLKVVAEGVETEEQSRLLRLLGCDEMQGYLFSRPVPAAIFERKFLAPPVTP